MLVQLSSATPIMPDRFDVLGWANIVCDENEGCIIDWHQRRQAPAEPEADAALVMACRRTKPDGSAVGDIYFLFDGRTELIQLMHTLVGWKYDYKHFYKD